MNEEVGSVQEAFRNLGKGQKLGIDERIRFLISLWPVMSRESRDLVSKISGKSKTGRCERLFVIILSVVVALVASPIYVSVVIIKVIEKLGVWILLVTGITILVLGLIAGVTDTRGVPLAATYVGIAQSIVIGVMKMLTTEAGKTVTKYTEIYGPKSVSAFVVALCYKEGDTDTLVASMTNLSSLSLKERHTLEQKLKHLKRLIFDSNFTCSLIYICGHPNMMDLPGPVEILFDELYSECRLFISEHTDLTWRSVITWDSERTFRLSSISNMDLIAVHDFWKLDTVFKEPGKIREFVRVWRMEVEAVEKIILLQDLERGVLNIV
jgi:hypothetical protein